MSANASGNWSGDFGSHNALVLSDAIALIERVPTGAVDLCYIDPPLFPKIANASVKDGPRIMREHLLSLAKVLQQARRCLASTGNIFVHSEPEMNGSIRLLLDQIFHRENFRQEIIVPRPTPRNRGGLSAGHDTVFHFSAGSDFVFNSQSRELAQDEIIKQFSKSDGHGPYRVVSLVSPIRRPSLVFEWEGMKPATGRSWKFSRERLEQLRAEGRLVLSSQGAVLGMKQYAAETTGTDVGTVWDDLPLRLTAGERSDYPTQKPERLVERLIKMGSNEGGMVLDPFCGSGTTLVAASKMGRRWIGGDFYEPAIDIATQRLQNECLLAPGTDFVSSNEELLKSVGGPHSVSFERIATGFDDLFAKPVGSLVFGEPLEIEETREYEFKEVTSGRPLSSIANTSDEYAVAFLNSEGGRIFWGVRDTDRVVVGVKLTFEERDQLRQTVTNKLGNIRPSIDPTAYRLELHSVDHPEGITDLIVVELVVPKVKASTPYFTGGNEAFVRLDGVKRKLVGPELSEWILRRVSTA